jgi:hypothetical protein
MFETKFDILVQMQTIAFQIIPRAVLDTLISEGNERTIIQYISNHCKLLNQETQKMYIYGKSRVNCWNLSLRVFLQNCTKHFFEFQQPKISVQTDSFTQFHHLTLIVQTDTYSLAQYF